MSDFLTLSKYKSTNNNNESKTRGERAHDISHRYITLELFFELLVTHCFHAVVLLHDL